jgi:hypothetical protein
MKCSTEPKAIEYLASIGMADTVSKYITELEAENARLKAEVERLQSLFKKVDSCRYDITSCKLHPEDAWGIPSDWRADMFNLHLKRIKLVIEEAKEVHP